jgi:hypothetical protein
MPRIFQKGVIQALGTAVARLELHRSFSTARRGSDVCACIKKSAIRTLLFEFPSGRSAKMLLTNRLPMGVHVMCTDCAITFFWTISGVN